MRMLEILDLKTSEEIEMLSQEGRIVTLRE
jgi:hypothetical protein